MRAPKLLSLKVLLVLWISFGAIAAQDDPMPSATKSIQDKKTQSKGDPNPSKNPSPANRQDQSKSKSKDKSGQQQSGSQDNQSNDSQNQSSTVAAPAPSNSAIQAYLTSSRRQFLGRTPRMFGDWFRPGITLTTVSEVTGSNGLFSVVQIPQAGRVGKISENNAALPYDRIFVNYSYFHNAFRGTVLGPDLQSISNAPSIERYTVGLEKTFFDGMTSLEARFVMSDVSDFVHTPVGPGPGSYQTFNPTMGNLSLIGKVLLAENESTALAAGMAVELPTGGDTLIQSGTTHLEIENQSVYLSPYIGLLKKPTDSPWFANAFVQVETPIWGDQVRGIDPLGGTPTDFGRLNSQTTIYVDVGVGRWLYQQQGGTITGVAGFIEAHYNGALNASDDLSDSFSSNSASSTYSLNTAQNKFNIVDLTFGLHFEIANQTKLRIAGVVPVTQQRSFDSEIGIQLSRHR